MTEHPAKRLSQNTIKRIIAKKIPVAELTNEDLIEFCQIANRTYRGGDPIIPDETYDFVFLKELKKRLPNHPFLTEVEPEENALIQEKVALPQTMLSLDKSYSWEELEKWKARLTKSAQALNIPPSNVELRCTPKLDGFAGFDDGTRLYTRGDGKRGSDITRAFDRGLAIFNNNPRGLGPGEIVVKKSYFKKHLAKHFVHSRNFIASLIKEKDLDQRVALAVRQKGVFFVPFKSIPEERIPLPKLAKYYDTLIKNNLSSKTFDETFDFDTDGVVIEATNTPLKNIMGANRKFHRWQIALKENKQTTTVFVRSLTPQVGRTGKITPVAELEPTVLSGATLSRATAHHYQMVYSTRLGPGSLIELTRSGMVIPKIIRVIKGTQPDVPSRCPSCQSPLEWDSDFLVCTNHQNCPAQRIEKNKYFFKTLANNDGFGEATLRKLYDNKVRDLSSIYKLNTTKLERFGFGKKISQNLIAELERSRTEEVEDWRFLSAFSLPRLASGNCENLLKSFSLKELFEKTEQEITALEGFAESTASTIVEGLENIKDEFWSLYPTFNIRQNLPKNGDKKSSVIVFTGRLNHPREQLEAWAREVGMKPSKTITSKTDYLVIGEKPGSRKLKKAEELTTKILNETSYLELIGRVSV